jgi:hypothetical protein
VAVTERSNFTDEGRDKLRDSDGAEKAIFICSVSKRPFRIVSKEIQFYRNQNIPLPDKHPDIRHIERLQTLPR